jgi:hypothetical protein
MLPTPVTKVVFFQFKIAEDNKATLDLPQLDQLANEPRVRGRGFVAAVDKETGEMTIQNAESLWKAAPKVSARNSMKPQETWLVRPSGARWLDVRTWFREWLQCLHAPKSAAGDEVGRILGDITRHKAMQAQGEVFFVGDLSVGAVCDLSLRRA